MDIKLVGNYLVSANRDGRGAFDIGCTPLSNSKDRRGFYLEGSYVAYNTSCDSKIITTTDRYNIQVWNAYDLKLEPVHFECDGIDKVNELRISDRWAVMRTFDDEIIVWDLNGDTIRRITKPRNYMHNFGRVSGDYLIIYNDTSVLVYDLRTEDKPTEIAERFCTLNGDYLLTRLNDCLNVRQLSDVSRIQYSHTNATDGEYRISTDGDTITDKKHIQSVLVWNVDQPNEPVSIAPKKYYSLNPSATPYRNYVIVNWGCHRFVIYDAHTGEILRTIDSKRAYFRDGMLYEENVITNLFKVDCVEPLLVADVLPSDVLYDVFKLL
jgi:hypothetical protein